MKKAIFVAASAVALLIATSHLVLAKNMVVCTGILIEVDMNPRADFPMAVVYDDGDSLDVHTCVLDLGRAGHWPLKGMCQNGEKCRISGWYFKKVGNTYYMRDWDKAEHVPRYDEIPSGR